MDEKREGESNFAWLSRVSEERWKKQADAADARKAQFLYRMMGWEQVDNGDGTFSYREVDGRPK